MNTQRIVFRLVFICMLLPNLASCVQNLPYHVVEPTKGNCHDPSSNQCTESYYQSYDNFELAFLEYSERGNAFDHSRVQNVLDLIKGSEQEQEDGVVIVTYVHGWTHNADDQDRDVREFKQILQNLSNNRGSSSDVLFGRRLVGVYVGWRGASLDVPYLDLLTFWDRKGVAEEVGKGAVTELLLSLDRLDKKDSRNVFITIGHSFGGAIVLSALSEIIVEGLIRRTGEENQIRGVGDGVILLNPAIEANQALVVVETALSQEYPQGQDPLLVALSTDADWATHYAFPAGQTVGLLVTWRQADLTREYYVDRRTNQPVALREEDLDTATVGNFAPFLTHRLTLEPSNDATSNEGAADTASQIKLRECKDVPESCVSRGWARTPDHVGLKQLPDNYPFYFIKTDAEFMNGHSDIFNTNVISFLTAIIDFRMRKAYGRIEKSRPSILRDSGELEDRYRRYRGATLQRQSQ